MQKTACFTGHRPSKLPWHNNEDSLACRTLKLRLQCAILAAYEGGYTHFITGMAQGFDLYAAEAVLRMKDTLGDLTLECAIPYPGQSSMWPKQDKSRYCAILDRADAVSIISNAYSSGCMRKRNQYMVDHSSLVIAAALGVKGGTLDTLQYAKKQGLDIVCLEIPSPEEGAPEA